MAKAYKVLFVNSYSKYIEDRNKQWKFGDSDPQGFKLQEVILTAFAKEGWRLVSTAAPAASMTYLYLERDV